MAGTSSRGKKAKTTYQPTPAEVEILRMLALFHYLTVEQILRVFQFKRGMLTTVQGRMARLTTHGFCIRRIVRKEPAKRHSPTVYVYALGNAGRRYVMHHLETEVPSRFRPGDMPKDDKLRHVIAATDVAISVFLLGTESDRVTLEQLYVERVLRGMGEPVEVDGRPKRVTPDDWFAVSVRQGEERHRGSVIVEVDMHTERQKRWREKVRGLLAWGRSPQYQTLFGLRAQRVAVVTPGYPRHAAVLRAWTEAELRELGREEAGKSWYFTGENPATTAPRDFFSGRIWLQPFTDGLVAALPLGVSGA